MDRAPNTPEPADPAPPASQVDQQPPRAEGARTSAGDMWSGELWSGRGGWIGGVVLVVLGLIFLLQNFELLDLDNWWALFILIPAVGSFATAWSSYQRSGRWSAAARGSLIGGLVFTLVALAFLFNLDFGSIWPVFLILGGLSLLVNAMLPD